jgi:hypothetical protein
MTDYTKTVDFAVKDSLPTGNPAKVIKGTEINVELANLQTSNNSKADLASPTFTGTVGGFNMTLTGALEAASIDGGTY